MVGQSIACVSGMSTGFSGNLGYPLPSNWAFDQISTITIGSGSGQIQIDNNIKSGKDKGQSSVGGTLSSINSEFFKQMQSIYELALRFNENNIDKANDLVLNYYRRKYDSFIFEYTIGPINMEFFEYVNKTLSIDYKNNLIELTDPRNPQEKIDPKHLAATLQGVKKFPAIPIIQTHYRDLVGWGGDLLTTFVEIIGHRDESKYKGSVLERTYQAAYDYIAPTELPSHFEYEDFVGDIDAFNIALTMLADPTVPIHDAFINYYEGAVSSRYHSFYRDRFKSSEENLYKYTLQVLTEETADMVIARKILMDADKVPSYTRDEAAEVSKAFRDKLLSYLRKENI